MESKNFHMDRFHGLVYSARGGLMTPLHVAALLQAARREGELPKPAASETGDTTVAKSVSGVGESAPRVEHLDLRQQP